MASRFSQEVERVSADLVVNGTMQEIVGKLNLLVEVCKNREATGYPALMGDESWTFTTAKDERVCPVCGAMDDLVFQGDAIPEKFPFYEFVSDTEILPNVHRMYPSLKGVCRCNLEWRDAAEVLESRLHDEKIMAVR